jgi:hypothetical protein
VSIRPVDRHGRVQDIRLSGEAVALVIRKRVAEAGFDPARCSGHSLRAGLARLGSDMEDTAPDGPRERRDAWQIHQIWGCRGATMTGRQEQRAISFTCTDLAKARAMRVAKRNAEP